MSDPAGPKSAPSRRRTGRRRVRLRALWRHQPRHRAAGLRRPGAGERIRPHARAVHGRRLPVSGEIRLCDRWRGSRRAGDLVGRIGFALHPHQTVFTVPAETVGCCPRRAAARARARRQHGDGAQRRVGCRARPGRPHRGGRRRRGRRAGRVAVREMPGAEVTLVDIEPRGPGSRARSGWASRCPSTRRATATS